MYILYLNIYNITNNVLELSYQFKSDANSLRKFGWRYDIFTTVYNIYLN